MKGPAPARPLYAPHKPRPLGQVRKETLQFTATTAAVNNPALSPVYPDLSRLAHGQDDRCDSPRIMHDLRETLRHAALLNIVAAANSDTCLTQETSAEVGSHGHPGTRGPGHYPSAPTQRPQSRAVASSFSLTSDSNHLPVAASPTGSSTLSLRHVTTLLSPPARTISIPSKPRVQDLPAPFVSKPAPEHAQKQDDEIASAPTAAAASRGTRMTDSKKLARPISVADINFSGPAAVPPVHRHSWEPVYDHHNSGDASLMSTSSPNTCLHPSDTAPYSLSYSPALLPGSAYVKNSGNCSSPALAPGAKDRKDQGVGSSSSRHRSSTNLQQLSHGRWQLTVSRKRELVKRLSEVAKCDAVDMTEAVGEGRGEPPVPPMIIFSQVRQETRHSNDNALHSANERINIPLPSTPATERKWGNNGSGRHWQEAQSLKRYASLAKIKKSPTRASFGLSVDGRQGRMSDVTLHAYDDACPHDHSDLTSDSDSPDVGLFMRGVVGRSIESRENQLPEPRTHSTWTPSKPRAPKKLDCKTTRPSPQSQGEGCLDSVGQPSSNSRSRAFRLPRSSTETSLGGLVNGGSPLSTHTPALPTLTITGLSREKSGQAGSDISSRAAHEGRSPRHLDYVSSMKLFQQLDDQCERLQRQLSLSLGLSLDRQPPLWQHAPREPTHPPVGRHDTAGHDGRDGAPKDNNRRGRSDLSSRRTGSVGAAEVTAARSAVVEPSDVTGNDDAVCGVNFGDGGVSMWVADTSVTPHVEVLGKQDASDKQRESGCDGQLEKKGEVRFLSENSLLRVHSVGSLPDPAGWVPNLDPVLQATKEPRYQGPSSMVSENRPRSQFHYIKPRRTDVNRVERQMKYRVLKALDQEVYDDFQHKKFRNSSSATVAKVHGEEDRARVHFYKVKVEGD